MTGEIWTYVATKPSDSLQKVRPILIIGDDINNGLKFIDIHYVIISSSADCGKYDIELDEKLAIEIGLARKSIIKTTKIYTGTKTKLGNKIGDLPENVKINFIEKYREYQLDLISKFQNSKNMTVI